MSNNEQEETSNGSIPRLLQITVVISIILATVLIGLYYLRFSDFLEHHEVFEFVSDFVKNLKKDSTAWGTLGDYIGGILNPLFSLTALFALLHTIKLQSKELHESTKQLKASAEAFKLQNNMMMRQQFETSFFQMLGLFNQMVNEVSKSTDSSKGRLCLVSLARSVQHLDVSIENNNLEKQYHDEIHDRYRYILAPYFRTLYSIVNFIDISYLEDNDKILYINIVRSQLSEHELVLLFYNCLSLPNARQKFLPLVKKYRLLKNLDKKLLANPEHYDLLFDNSNARIQ